MSTTFSHFGICVSDLERSVRFYTEGLGFARAETHDIGDEFARLMGLESVALTSQFLRKETTAIELLAFAEPSPFGERFPRQINQLGLTHLSFRVSDVGEVAQLLVSLGGSIIEATLTTMDFAESSLEFLYCTDPDGVRIELMDLGG
jgi:catechol 2,3-dioxygenase-like lactoylglutathione lyase family enzyme